jgi:hypothetical protein
LHASVAAGSRPPIASSVLLAANPLADVNHTRAIDTVVLRGQLFDRLALDSLLRRAAAAAR